MAIVTVGRIVRGVVGNDPSPREQGHADERSGKISPRLVPKQLVDASIGAEAILSLAHAEADAILHRAREAASHESARAAQEARDVEIAKLAAGFLVLRRREERRLEADLDRVVALSVMLAERLVHETIEARPERIVAMARAALAEARGTRRALVEANPLDAATLTMKIDELGLEKEAVEIRTNPELARGELCLHTDLGTLDARLTPQLERLASALRDALRA